MGEALIVRRGSAAAEVVDTTYKPSNANMHPGGTRQLPDAVKGKQLVVLLTKSLSEYSTLVFFSGKVYRSNNAISDMSYDHSTAVWTNTSSLTTHGFGDTFGYRVLAL